MIRYDRTESPNRLHFALTGPSVPGTTGADDLVALTCKSDRRSKKVVGTCMDDTIACHKTLPGFVLVPCSGQYATRESIIPREAGVGLIEETRRPLMGRGGESSTLRKESDDAQ
jgi:hypothetical protein